MNYALIGCGRISPNHIRAAKNNRLKFVGLCDIHEDVLRRTALNFELKNVHQYCDYHEMIEKENPEIVAIATESGKHSTIALDCIEAGCNLIIEKPIALSISDADAIINAARKRE